MIKKCCMCFLFAGLVIVAAGAVQASQIFYDTLSIQNEGGVPFNGLNGAAQICLLLTAMLRPGNIQSRHRSGGRAEPTPGCRMSGF